LSLRQAADAKIVHDTIAGSTALVPFLTDSRTAANVSEIVNVEWSGTDVVVMIKLDHPDFWKKIGNVLQQTSDGLIKKNTADDGMVKE
jgi:hypothetical protein